MYLKTLVHSLQFQPCHLLILYVAHIHHALSRYAINTLALEFGSKSSTLNEWDCIQLEFNWFIFNLIDKKKAINCAKHIESLLVIMALIFFV